MKLAIQIVTVILSVIGMTALAVTYSHKTFAKKEEVKTLESKVDDIHWYLIRQNNVKVRKDDLPKK